jgi:hypothetical protein
MWKRTQIATSLGKYVTCIISVTASAVTWLNYYETLR